MKIAITGHRPEKLNKEYFFEGPCSFYLKNEISNILRCNEPETVITGMALGADQLFAEICLNESYIKKIIAAIPFEGQECKWPPHSVDFYNAILSNLKVEKVYVSKPGYAVWKMQKRNVAMVNLLDDPSDLLIAVFDGSSGGTANCVSYAKSHKKNIVVIDPRKYKE